MVNIKIAYNITFFAFSCLCLLLPPLLAALAKLLLLLQLLLLLLMLLQLILVILLLRVFLLLCLRAHNRPPPLPCTKLTRLFSHAHYYLLYGEHDAVPTSMGDGAAY